MRNISEERKHLSPFSSLAERAQVISQSAHIRENWSRSFDEYVSVVNSKVSALISTIETPTRLNDGGTSASYKDLISVKQLPSRFGSENISILPNESAEIVIAFEKAGIYTQGKARTTEFGVGNNFSDCINPLFPLFSPGGSSNGSAAAVTSGISDVSFGTDAAGSVRRPASFCGAVALVFGESEEYKRGVVPVSSSLERIGAVARTVDDMLYLWDRHDLSQIYSQQSAEVEKISLAAPYLPKQIDDEIAQSFEDYVAQIRSVGVPVERFDWEIWHQRHFGWKMIAYELNRFFEEHRETFPINQLRPSTKQTIESGGCISFNEYQDARARRDILVREVERFLASSGFSGILLPVDPYPVSRIPVQSTQHMLPLTSSDRFDPWNYMIIANVCNLSAISYPYRVSSRGFPMAVQIFARAQREVGVMKTAKVLSDLLPSWIETYELNARRQLFDEAASYASAKHSGCDI
ncbi:amidase family protein [Agrobacterium vitis]|uniref:amidase family protein n=1 Tax=Agrobacterium vitis TaxID=373 RepID=UPI0022A7B3C5|nr:amidase [Agrobacterium vitis]